MRELSASGKNVPLSKSDIITSDHEELLWTNSVLGTDNPTQLLATVIYQNGIHFALRISEHCMLTTENFQVLSEQTGRKLVYREFVSKNHNGGLKDIKKKCKEVFAYSTAHLAGRSIKWPKT